MTFKIKNNNLSFRTVFSLLLNIYKYILGLKLRLNIVKENQFTKRHQWYIFRVFPLTSV